MINPFYLTVIILTFCFSATTEASSYLSIDQDFNVVSVNGKSYNSGFITSDSKVKLRLGVNKIAIEYEVIFDHGDDFDLIKSETLLVSFYASRDKNYVLNYLRPANSRAARLFVKNPIINVLDNTGYQLKASSYFIGSKSDSFINQQTRPSITGQPPIRITSNKNPTKSKGNSTNLPQKQSDADAEERLNYWWRKATEKQRQSFLKKILND